MPTLSERPWPLIHMAVSVVNLAAIIVAVTYFSATIKATVEANVNAIAALRLYNEQQDRAAIELRQETRSEAIELTRTVSAQRDEFYRAQIELTRALGDSRATMAELKTEISGLKQVVERALKNERSDMLPTESMERRRYGGLAPKETFNSPLEP